MYGIAELLTDGKRVMRIVEKSREPKSNLTVIGVYAFHSSFFEVYSKMKPYWRNEMAITDAISLPIDSGSKVVPHNAQGGWNDTGKPEDILEANHLNIGRHRGVQLGRGRIRRVCCRLGADRKRVHHNRQVGRERVVHDRRELQDWTERIHRTVHRGWGPLSDIRGGGR